MELVQGSHRSRLGVLGLLQVACPRPRKCDQGRFSLLSNKHRDGLMLHDASCELKNCGRYSEGRIFEAPVIPLPPFPQISTLEAGVIKMTMVSRYRSHDDDLQH